jgi:hypothetical protein
MSLRLSARGTAASGSDHRSLIHPAIRSVSVWFSSGPGMFGVNTSTHLHSLGTGGEQFSVSRVTIVEWCLMLAGRVQKRSV